LTRLTHDFLRKREKKKKKDIINASYNTPWFTVPYLPKFADKFKEVIQRFKHKTFFLRPKYARRNH